jgi:hypothetical protein
MKSVRHRCTSGNLAIMASVLSLPRRVFMLMAIGNLLASSLCAQKPPSARPMSGLAVPVGEPCEFRFLPQLGHRPLNKKVGLTSGSVAAYHFTSLHESSRSGCHPSEGADLAKDASLPLGHGDVNLWASGQRDPAADKKSQSTSGTEDSPRHIFWVVPAYKVDYAKRFTPLSPREKFKEWAQSAYDPLGLGVGAFEAGTLEHSSRDGFCGYGKGWGGYGKCFGALEVDSDVSSFIGDYALTVVLHQDPRYFRLGEGSFKKRLWYAVSRVFVTYNDAGRTTFYSSALSGTVIAAGLSNLYYPQQDRGLGHTLSRIGIDFGNTALYNASAEFWPDIKRKLYSEF